MPRRNLRRKERPLTQCPLCRRVEKLCRSHIIPKFFVRDMRDGGPNWLEHDIGGNACPAPRQDGWKEFLLCRRCEQRIARWEKIVSEELKGRRRASFEWTTVKYDGLVWVPPTSALPEFRVLRVEDCDYTAWRLFQLSLLFKIGVSNLKFFCDVRLGTEESTLREMIQSEDPGAPMDYPCWMYVLSLETVPLKGFMSTPLQIRYKGYPAIELAFGGLGWLFLIAQNVQCETWQSFVLNRRGSMLLLERDARAVRWLIDGLRRRNMFDNENEAGKPN